MMSDYQVICENQKLGNTANMERWTIDPASQHPSAMRVFDQFSTFRTQYKLVDDQPIHAFFIVPDQLPSGPRPLLVRFHGGGWVEGEAEASIRAFFLELSLKHGAVILTPNYRLRPEHQLTDGMDDIHSFWQWVEDGSAQRALSTSRPDVAVDVGNLMVAGESTGGHIAVLTALLPLTSLAINVLFLQYPTLNLTDVARAHNDVSEAMQKSGLWAERVPYSEVEDCLRAHAQSEKQGTLRTRAAFGSRMRLLMGMLQAGRFWDEERDGDRLCPMRALDRAGKLPPILLYHSKGDELLPWQHTEDWAAKLRRLQPDVPLFLTFQQGDHVFDKDDTMRTPWLREPLEFVQQYWPA
ncbi:Alpha/Beta hydrolase protein [Chaetomium strumarium]|uniref:Alpha/Beta hydrolase protein n=1 Tax=Chaetomium strumarium TaxID=1170767 RepID=A0AAJ0GVB2_9PEZI|nr:Alpha/Beta hydrolase protein [Chaetomium strumarium]